MATKWHTVSTKFTDEELQIIDHACIKYKTNRSHIIRILVSVGLKIEEFSQIINDPKSPTAKTLIPIIKTMFNKKTLTDLEKEIDKKQSKINPAIKQSAINQVQNTNTKFKVFEKHNPVGAPSQKHGKSGRPSKKDMSN